MPDEHSRQRETRRPGLQRSIEMMARESRRPPLEICSVWGMAKQALSSCKSTFILLLFLSLLSALCETALERSVVMPGFSLSSHAGNFSLQLSSNSKRQENTVDRQVDGSLLTQLLSLFLPSDALRNEFLQGPSPVDSTGKAQEATPGLQKEIDASEKQGVTLTLEETPESSTTSTLTIHEDSNTPSDEYNESPEQAHGYHGTEIEATEEEKGETLTLEELQGKIVSLEEMEGEEEQGETQALAETLESSTTLTLTIHEDSNTPSDEYNESLEHAHGYHGTEIEASEEEKGEILTLEELPGKEEQGKILSLEEMEGEEEQGETQALEETRESDSLRLDRLLSHMEKESNDDAVLIRPLLKQFEHHGNGTKEESDDPFLEETTDLLFFTGRLLGGRGLDQGAMPQGGMNVLLILLVLTGAVTMFLGVVGFQHAAVLGSIAYCVVSGHMGKRPSPWRALKAGLKSGVLHLMWLSIVHATLRGLGSLFLMKAVFGGAMEMDQVEQLVLRFSVAPFAFLAPFRDAELMVPTMAVRMGLFIASDYALDGALHGVYAVAGWVTVVERSFWGFGAFARSWSLVKSMPAQALTIKVIESIACGRSSRWLLQKVVGQFFALFAICVFQAYFLVLWLVFYFSARSRHDGTARFSHRNLEDFLDRFK